MDVIFLMFIFSSIQIIDSEYLQFFFQEMLGFFLHP